MKIIGFNFTEMSAKRLANPNNQLKINSTIDIADIRESNSDLIKVKGELINVDFSHQIKYEPDFAELFFKGNILFLMDSKYAKEISKSWKTKAMPEDFKVLLFNAILKKTTLKALQLEEELNMPLHIKLLPSLKLDKKETQNNS